MNIHFGKQSQFELFPNTTGEPIETVAPRFIFSRVVLTFENLVVVLVFVIVSLVVAFSVGVERGRRAGAVVRPAVKVASTAPAALNPLPHPQISVTPVMPAPLKATGTAQAASVTPFAAPQLTIAPAADALEKTVDKRYTIQVASYKLSSDAQREAAALRAKGMDPFVLQKGNYSILCIGRYATSQEAKVGQKKLLKQYKDCIIRSL